MPKQYVKLRIGLLDHLPTFATNPDAMCLYVWCLLQAPMSGPDAGCVRINQALLAESWEWSRPRVNRAVKWLQTKPSRQRPLLVLVEKGGRNRPGRYAIPRYETTENRRRFSNGDGTKPSGFVSDSVTQVERIRRFVSDSVTEMEPNINRIARVRKNEEYKEQGGRELYESKSWITVTSEAEARQALIHSRGYGQIPEELREAALVEALKNLEFYRIRYLDDPEPETEDADYEEAEDWTDPFAEASGS